MEFLKWLAIGAGAGFVIINVVARSVKQGGAQVLFGVGAASSIFVWYKWGFAEALPYTIGGIGTAYYLVAQDFQHGGGF